MLIHFLKFFHILLALGLLGVTSYCLALINSLPDLKITRLNKSLLIMSQFALLTGTLLVHPKHYTLETPWIQAAYILLFTFCLGIILVHFLKKKYKLRWLWQGAYLILLIILIFITHDAVTKTTFILDKS